MKPVGRCLLLSLGFEIIIWDDFRVIGINAGLLPADGGTPWEIWAVLEEVLDRELPETLD